MDVAQRAEAGTSSGGRWGEALLTAGRGVPLAVMSLGFSLALFIASVVSIAFMLLGVGWLTTPWLLDLVRLHANQRRALAGRWVGLDIPVPYRPLATRDEPGLIAHLRRCLDMVRDPATWRDLAWLLTDAVAGFATALLCVCLVVYPLYGYVLLAGVWVFVQGNDWYLGIPILGFGTTVLAALAGTVLGLVGLRVNRYVLLGHFLIARFLLAPTENSRLERRVEQLYETRHDAVDSSAAELRRIERDLHDGAQARLVAMGMSLSTIEALIEEDPATAKKLVSQAREDSAEALTELRDLVRGIHPPVLAERGLGDATKALALRMPIPVEVEVDLPRRFPEPVESTAYFAISEVLTNAAKHSEASTVWLDLHHSTEHGGMLRVAITDDGKGGADLDKGSGIAGLERRLGQFDGILAISSPRGGPTLVTMEIPCVPVSHPTP
ncbi:histidine kinase [Streptomyces sp. NPDC005438]|uniref:sensor histidine kinase n=1 Tax=Streptomyces sp. NPDC005438 TaxID=3156880 RepID=UPI0033AA498E